MDIQFNETTVQACQELARLTKTVQLTMESVVPDTKDDIGRILSVRPEVYLKSKELRNRCASIGGEAVVTVLYINETESAVSSFSFSQSFQQEYELAAAEDDDLLQIRLCSSGLQARALNPRKLSVDLEISSELSVHRSCRCTISEQLPADTGVPVHLQSIETNVVLYTGVCEKSISLNDQLQFPEGSQTPTEMIGKEVNYCLREKEIVGGRLLIKGDVNLTLYFFPEGSSIPASCQFQLPFSQLIDLGGEDAEEAELWFLPTSDYVNLIESIDGRKLLDAEFHALVQVRSRRKQPIQYISDAYSNQMPCECQCSEQMLTEAVVDRQLRLTADESIEMPEEYQELLSYYAELGPCTVSQGSVVLDLLCRSKDEKLFAMRRNIALSPESDPMDVSGVSFTLKDFAVRQNGGSFNVRISVEGEGQEIKQTQIRRITALNLDEERAYDLSAYPSLTAVWAETESIWELAKYYHSSPEAILALNEELPHRPVFVPKTK